MKLNMEKGIHNKTSNKDVPVEQTIHYIVKDYRRMFNQHDKFLSTLLMLKEQIAKHEHKAFNDEKRIRKLENTLENVKMERDKLKSKLNRKPSGSSVSLCGKTENACSILFYGKGGICCEHRLSYEEIGSLYVKLGDYLQGTWKDGT